MHRLVPLLCLLALGPAVRADDFEFFETKVRPVLVEHCYACHSEKAKKLKGGLRLDSREAMLKGGDTGPAVAPGQPDKSLLIEAISYRNVDLTMPPRAKLTDAVIADLTTWVKSGAIWPPSNSATKAKASDFDLQQRMREHWAWQPVRRVRPPGDKGHAVDRFLEAAMRVKGLEPARLAEPHVLFRRLHFDLIGLPPSPEEVEAFEKACAGHRPVPQEVLEKTVDALLASPHFGERWGRHWLDLVRYAESRGHEFDYNAPNAYQYRDYVIRALNADVSYDQFVMEHVAGDLLPKPRLDARTGVNESIVGTGFWFLGEQVHSPVDTCQDKADRFDNMLDVFGKAFLGLTVACARCHDHKFDAISARDYYSLFGFLESSSYRLAPFDTMEHHRKLATAIDCVRSDAAGSIRQACASMMRRDVERLPDYLLRAAGFADAESAGPLNEKRVAAWKEHLQVAAKDPTNPFHLWGRLMNLPRVAAVTAEPRPMFADWQPREEVRTWPGAETIVDYARCPPEQWLPGGPGFGPRPWRAGEARLRGEPGGRLIEFAEADAAVRDLIWDRVQPAPEAEKEPGKLGGTPRFNRTLCTPKFTVTSGQVHYLVRGTGTVFAAVDGHIMLSGPLHGQTLRTLNLGERFQWLSHNLTRYKGRRVHLEFTGVDGADLAIACVVQSETPPPAGLKPPPLPRALSGRETWLGELAREYRQLFLDASVSLRQPSASSNAVAARLANWSIRHRELIGSTTPSPWTAIAPWQQKLGMLFAEIKTQTRLAPALLDNVGVDEQVYIRGNYKTPGERTPRRFLEALAGSAPLSAGQGSGRLELARQIVHPERNPLFARAMVNRVWHHLFGRGLVASVDNLGVLGERPSDPELLDFLADQFVRDGWSVKRAIRELVLTEAYRRTSTPTDGANRLDATNVAFSHQNLRRLEGEVIRDAMLTVSGRLDRTPFGPSVPIALTDFQQGRGRPASGPLDGNGRRSVYLSVRRNFLSPFLLAFDAPIPFSSVGRRSVSNVPAQALLLLNDPFVHQQADVWARRVLQTSGSTEDRLRRMYVSAYGRGPTLDEIAACSEYMRASSGDGEPAAWAGVAHVLFNAKEFLFVE